MSHMKPPMPKAVCEEEMQSTHLDNSEVIIEYKTYIYLIRTGQRAYLPYRQ